MSSTSQAEQFKIPSEANFISQGRGQPVVMIHGLAASLHDWDFLVPALAKAGYSGYALDLLGHGDSPKPNSRAYKMDWLFEHFLLWLQSLHLAEPPVLIGHSLGGFLALQYAWRFREGTRALVLVDPFYSSEQLPPFMRITYRRPLISGFIAHKTPERFLRLIIDLWSLSMGHSAGGLHALPESVRAQTALDYLRTAPSAYNILRSDLDLTPNLSDLAMPVLVAWGERDRTLAPASFSKLVAALPNARGESTDTGHVPHQSDAAWFNKLVLEFLNSLAQAGAAANTTASLRTS